MPGFEGVFVETVGWLGAGLVILAYVLISMGKVSGSSASYQVMNVFGALGIAINSLWNGAIPSTATNVIWMGIGLFALRRILRQVRVRAPVVTPPDKTPDPLS